MGRLEAIFLQIIYFASSNHMWGEDLNMVNYYLGTVSPIVVDFAPSLKEVRNGPEAKNGIKQNMLGGEQNPSKDYIDNNKKNIFKICVI